MRQSAKRTEQDLSAAPRRGGRRDVQHHLVIDRAEATVDQGLVGKLFFEQGDTHARQGSFERTELAVEVHEGRVRPGLQPRNLEVCGRRLVRWRSFDSPGETMDR